MYSALRRILAVALPFVLCFSGTAAFPQAVKFIRRAADPLPLANLTIGRAPCTKDSSSAVDSNAATAATGDSASSPEGADRSDTPTCDAPPMSVPSANPCSPTGLAQTGCDARRDLVQEDLATRGKTGQKILRARERVLAILQTENACSAWFREKDSNPADTFRTLNYAVDRHGEEFVHVSKDVGSDYIYRDPYVASVGQDTGAFATITLNAGGAFFHAQTTMLVVPKDGGQLGFGGPRSVNIGPYPGDSVTAQTLALLHEFGHVLDLLPTDFDNEDGKSVRNTGEVLRYCRAEIDSKVKRGTLSAAR